MRTQGQTASNSSFTFFIIIWMVRRLPRYMVIDFEEPSLTLDCRVSLTKVTEIEEKCGRKLILSTLSSYQTLRDCVQLKKNCSPLENTHLHKELKRGFLLALSHFVKYLFFTIFLSLCQILRGKKTVTFFSFLIYFYYFSLLSTSFYFPFIFLFSLFKIVPCRSFFRNRYTFFYDFAGFLPVKSQISVFLSQNNSEMDPKIINKCGMVLWVWPLLISFEIDVR